MKVKFEFENEMDIVAAPEGWRWVGTMVHPRQYVALQQTVTTIEPQAIGSIGIDDNGVTAGYKHAGGAYQWLGEFPDTRSASLAVVKALGLEVEQ